LESYTDIDTAIVVSIPDALFQEVGIAFVIGKSSESINNNQLVSFCKTLLSNYKVPKKIIFLNEFPMLPIGKVDKVQLKKLAMESK
jgi:non-ribosomal peptide synthetase component E (peptide arylation enzyme)